MKNFIWIAIFFTLGYATPIDQVGDKDADFFQCSWGKIPITLRCDGTNNCGDNSDEESCEKDKDADFFQCSWGKIPITLRCDGTNNCGDNSDEESCEKASKFMVTSGYPRSSATRKTEIVDVANGLTCSDLAEFPEELSAAVGANLGGTPVVCGGYSSGYSEKCFKLKKSGWEQYASMKEKRELAAAVMHNDRLHVFGGYSGSILQTTETINVDGEVSDGPDLPTGVYGHAMTKINGSVSLLSGGITDTNSYSAKTYYYNHDTETFTSGPDLMEGRRYHGSALNVDKVTKAKIVVVTGGLKSGIVRLDSTVLLINGQWQTGPPLPKAIFRFSMLEMHGDTYVIGGYGGGGEQSSIYQLSCSSGLCSWTTLNQQLKVARHSPVAIAVQDNLCT